jgi:hypothetical protein
MQRKEFPSPCEGEGCETISLNYAGPGEGGNTGVEGSGKSQRHTLATPNGAAPLSGSTS